MGTIMNNNIWSGVCVKNEEVTGLVKNGSVFYEKIIGEIYKRRVMVGDNLKGKFVYNDFPDNWYENMVNRMSSSDIITYITFDNIYNGIYEMTMPSFSETGKTECYQKNTHVEDNESNYGNMYYITSDNYNTLKRNTVLKMLSDQQYIVSKVIDTNPSYRHVYVEDTHIRPLNVGDIITKDTVLYFNFPDDIYKTLDANTTTVFELDNMNTGMYITSFYMGETDISIIAMIEYGAGSSNTLYEVVGGTLKKNISKGVNIADGTSVFSGTVTKIYKDNLLYNYILVDTTTLG